MDIDRKPLYDRVDWLVKTAEKLNLPNSAAHALKLILTQCDLADTATGKRGYLFTDEVKNAMEEALGITK